MRYLGKKTRLLPHIRRVAARIGFMGGTLCDLFAGSGVVGRYFRGCGCRVIGTDLMVSSHVFQRIFLELERAPSFDALRARIDLPAENCPRPPAPGASEVCLLGPQEAEGRRRERPRVRRIDLPGDWGVARRVLRYLDTVAEPRTGLFTRQYSPAGDLDRMYFHPDTARRVDAVVGTLREWHAGGLLEELERDLLTACLIDAADERANISGTYGAYLKRWQRNALEPFALRLPELRAGPPGRAGHGDAQVFVETAEADCLYLDPPYNNRQYPANYHLLDVIARAVREADLGALEASVYGKTGLVPWEHQRSALCSRRGDRCRDAFRELLRATSIPRVVISYNEEGIITRDQFEEMLAEYAGVARARLGRVLTEVPFGRFRSDADGRVGVHGAGRQYRQLEGRGRDEVHEWLYHVARDGAR